MAHIYIINILIIEYIDLEQNPDQSNLKMIHKSDKYEFITIYDLITKNFTSYNKSVRTFASFEHNLINIRLCGPYVYIKRHHSIYLINRYVTKKVHL